MQKNGFFNRHPANEAAKIVIILFQRFAVNCNQNKSAQGSGSDSFFGSCLCQCDENDWEKTMPYLKVNTNMSVSSEDAAQLLTGLSQLMATEIGKPESYVMVELESGKAMSFAGSTETLAYLECKSIGLPVEKTKPLSAALCQKLQESLSIPAARVYIEFADAKAAYWGWNNSTFG